MSYILAIIDMQPVFSTSKEKHLEKPILREIALAKKKAAPIMIVEYDLSYYTPEELKTYDYIMDPLKGYHSVIKVYKKNDGGDDGMHAAYKRHKLTQKRFRVVGVNTTACVYQTVVGLTDKSYDVTVVSDACWTHSRERHNEGIERLHNCDGVKIIRHDGKLLRY